MNPKNGGVIHPILFLQVAYEAETLVGFVSFGSQGGLSLARSRQSCPI